MWALRVKNCKQCYGRETLTCICERERERVISNEIIRLFVTERDFRDGIVCTNFRWSFAYQALY